MKKLFGATVALMIGVLAGCGKPANQETVGGVSPEEAAALNNAAEMLDTSPDSLAMPADMPIEAESNSGNVANDTAP